MAKKFQFRMPQDTQRLAIVGKTGTGKTQAAAWHLSQRSFDLKPWIILDFKRDELLNEIGATEVDMINAPTKPGLYITHPLPDDKEAVENYFWNIWQKENIGVYIDEGYMIGDSPAFRALLTQGRSKRIPIIVLSQRPSWISRFVFSESDYHQVFWLNDFRDRKTVSAFVPYDMENRLEDYHSVWYDVSQDRVAKMLPVPKKSAILQVFEDRLKPKKTFI